MDSIVAPAHRGPQAYHNSGSRPPGEISLVVIHDTEGGTAETIARYFASPTSGGSSHLVCDDSQTIRCLPDSLIPWAAPGANTQGVHVELCGFAKWANTDWHHHEAMLHRAAYQVSLWCKQYDIPATYLNAQGLRAGKRGITTHAAVTQAFHLSTHTNPGPGFPLSYFIALTQTYLDPPPPPDRFGVRWTKEDGTPGVKGPMTKSDLDDFAGIVLANHADEDHPFKYEVTMDPKGWTPES